MKHSDPRAIFCNTIHIGSTENAGPENGGPKKDERTENAGLKMKDQMSGVENAGPKHQDRKMEDQQPEADYEI